MSVYPDELVHLLCEDIAYNKGGMYKHDVLKKYMLSKNVLACSYIFILIILTNMPINRQRDTASVFMGNCCHSC